MKLLVHQQKLMVSSSRIVVLTPLVAALHRSNEIFFGLTTVLLEIFPMRQLFLIDLLLPIANFFSPFHCRSKQNFEIENPPVLEKISVCVFARFFPHL